MKRILQMLIVGFFIVMLTGCSHVLHKREPDKNNPADQGSETTFKLKGPRAVVQHNF